MKKLFCLIALIAFSTTMTVAGPPKQKKMPKSHRHISHPNPLKKMRKNAKRHATGIPVMASIPDTKR